MMLAIGIHQVGFLVHQESHLRLIVVYLRLLVNQVMKLLLHVRHLVVIIIRHVEPRVI